MKEQSCKRKKTGSSQPIFGGHTSITYTHFSRNPPKRQERKDLMYQLPFSENIKDQIRLQEAGGYIVPKANGNVVFQFDSQEDYQKYMEGKNNETYAAVAAHSY